MLVTTCPSLSSSSSTVPADNTSSTFPLLGAMWLRSMPSRRELWNINFSFASKTLKLYRSLVAASEAAAAKADAQQEKHLKLLAKEVANETPAEKLMRLLSV